MMQQSMVLLQDVSFILFLMDEMVNHYNDGGGHIESSNIYDEVASLDSIANAQTDMIFHYDEVVNFDTIANVQTDITRYPDKIASFGSMPGNQKDSFLSLLFCCFKTMIL